MSEILEPTPITHYLMMQAALPGSCYDPNAQTVATLVTAETQTPTPDWDVNPADNDPTKGYRGYLQAPLTGQINIVNFFNPVEFALATGEATDVCGFPLRREVHWEKNQELFKPDYHPTASWAYEYTPNHPDKQRRGVMLYGTFPRQVRAVTDTGEMKAFVARSRSKAAGAKDIGGSVDESINLQTEYGFGSTCADHSGQLTRRIQLVDDLYQVIREKAEQ